MGGDKMHLIHAYIYLLCIWTKHGFGVTVCMQRNVESEDANLQALFAKFSLQHHTLQCEYVAGICRGGGLCTT